LALPATNPDPKPTATKTTAAKPETAVTKKATPAPAQTQKTQSSGGVSGSFTGDAVDIGYGIMQVKISVSNGKIVSAQAIQAPGGRNLQWTDRAVPILRQQTLAANGSNIQGVSGASYTSYGWYTSLVAALKKAGMQ
jgi:uncharacterized protein with FMN-binding domain